MINVHFIQAKDLLKLGFTNSIHTCRYVATDIRKEVGRKRITAVDVAKFLYMNEEYVLRCISRK
jgi:cyanophycinase-like exopeptidase